MTHFDLDPAALWNPIRGYHGTISGIMKVMPHIPDSLWDMVRRVLVNVQECLWLEVQYRGERHSGSGGHNNRIELDYFKAHIIANDLEAGLLVKHSTMHVNEHHAECGLPKIHMGMSAVSRAMLRPATMHLN